MTKELHANYIKTIVSSIIKIKHKVRIKLDSTADNIINTLKKVPPEAKVTMIINDVDSEIEGCGEIVFEEIKPAKEEEN